MTIVHEIRQVLYRRTQYETMEAFTVLFILLKKAALLWSKVLQKRRKNQRKVDRPEWPHLKSNYCLQTYSPSLFQLPLRYLLGTPSLNETVLPGLQTNSFCEVYFVSHFCRKSYTTCRFSQKLAIDGSIAGVVVGVVLLILGAWFRKWRSSSYHLFLLCMFLIIR